MKMNRLPPILILALVLSISAVTALDLTDYTVRNGNIHLNKNQITRVQDALGIDLSQMTGETITQTRITINGINNFETLTIIVFTLDARRYTLVTQTSKLEALIK